MVDAEEVVKINPKIKTITEASPNSKCQFCQKHAINELEWGPMYELEGIVAHYYCMLFSAALTTNGNENEGILGFLPSDLKKEMRRGDKLKCKYCKKSRATVGCEIAECKATYHFPCGLSKGTMNQFTKNYVSFCPRHKRLPKLPFKVPVEGVLCEVCQDNVLPTENWVWPPCCKHRLYHRSCMQEYAKRAGYSFACPSCKATGEFVDAMKKSGVYIPNQDAAWERDPSFFQELTELYSKCDAKKCYCPHGRSYDAEYRRPANRNWKIVRCGDCGSSAVHYCCGQLKQMRWNCAVCATVKSPVAGAAGLANSSESSEDFNGDSDVEESVLEEYEKVRQNLLCRASIGKEAKRANENVKITEEAPRAHSSKRAGYGSRCEDRHGRLMCDSRKQKRYKLDTPGGSDDGAHREDDECSEAGDLIHGQEELLTPTVNQNLNTDVEDLESTSNVTIVLSGAELLDIVKRVRESLVRSHAIRLFLQRQLNQDLS